MSAFPDRPADFADYIAERGGTPEMFACRRDYGEYLASIFSKAVGSGLVKRVRGGAARASRQGAGWNVQLEDGTGLLAPFLVLATGNGAPGALPALRAIEPGDIVDELWSPAGKTRLARAADTAEPVLIAGTGLTMVDAVLSLDAAGYRGLVTAVSRRGLLPRPHSSTRGCTLPRPSLGELAMTVTSLGRWIRERSVLDGDWRSAVDSLRPLTQQIWQRMDQAEKRRFLRHGRIWWDVHRHRLAPEVHERLQRLIEEGRLRVMAGRISASRRQENGYAVSVARRGSGDMAEVATGLVLNCTGPSHGLSNHSDRLIAQMHADGLVRPDALGLGIETDSNNRVAGSRNAYAIGPMTKGRYWEVIAVPDLREKAAEIAAMIARDHAGDIGVLAGNNPPLR